MDVNLIINSVNTVDTQAASTHGEMIDGWQLGEEIRYQDDSGEQRRGDVGMTNLAPRSQHLKLHLDGKIQIII